jgi:hypothetical protein
MNFKKQITTKRLEEVLSTLNKNVIKKIILKPWSSHSPVHFDGCEIAIGYTTYSIFLGDSDPGYADNSVKLFIEILKKFDLPYVCEDFEYLTSEKHQKKIFNINTIGK